MGKLFKKASTSVDLFSKGKFEKYFLSENPFPSNPYVNKDSVEKKFNGSIYEDSIRRDEYAKFKTNFLEVPQSDYSHLRLGFLIDSSYIGRGNGKSAFLVNLTKKINENYALDLSDSVNKCFAIYFAPEGGGRTKTFEKFVDLFFEAIYNSGIINTSIAILRYESLIELRGKDAVEHLFVSEEEIVSKLNSDDFFEDSEEKPKLTRIIFKNEALQSLPKEFPLYFNLNSVLKPLVNQNAFKLHYYELKKDKERFDFLFTQLVSLFLAAGFVGAYVFIDDFERVPEFQSSIQRKDFATQLRTVQFDGSYLNSKIGFYNLIFALHAGVPRLMQEAWELAGLEQRVPINGNFVPRHNIMFEKINEVHAQLLIKRYLSEFRIAEKFNGDSLYPFNTEVVNEIARSSELNASRILQLANNLIEFSAEKQFEQIGLTELEMFRANVAGNPLEEGKSKDISTTLSIDLISKSKKEHE